MPKWSIIRIIFLLLIFCNLAISINSSTLCKHSGQRFVNDFIQFQCFLKEKSQLDARPIGCVPTNTSTGSVILPGLSFTGEHFRYSCVRKFDDTLTLKITRK